VLSGATLRVSVGPVKAFLAIPIVHVSQDGVVQPVPIAKMVIISSMTIASDVAHPTATIEAHVSRAR